MAAAKDSFLDLERRRLQLEENIAKFQRLRQHWQTWEAEHEGLKEEILGMGNGPGAQTLQELADDYGGTIMTPDEIKKLFRDDNGVERDSSRVLGLISRRVDYVQENIKATQKQLDAAETKLASLNVVIQPEARDDEGLPLTEITEELDDDDNVISRTVQQPGDSTPMVLEALQKRGFRNLPELSGLAKPAADSTPTEALPSTLNGLSGISRHGKLSERSEKVKKRVSFADSTKPQAERNVVDPSASSGKHKAPGNARPPRTVHEDVLRSLAKDAENTPSGPPVIPTGESPEDAALRTEMLEYSTNDIGAIVAEMDVDDEEEEEYSSDLDDNDEDEEEEDDQFGRTKARVISNEYRQQMLELERKLNAKSLVNVGSHIPGLEPALVSTDSIENNACEVVAKLPSSDAKKGVRFAEELDIRDASSPVEPPKVETPITTPKDRPISDSVVARDSPAAVQPDSPEPTKKVSRFKSARAEKPKPSYEYADRTKPVLTVTNGPLAGMSRSRLTAISANKKVYGPIYADSEEQRIVPEGPPGRPIAATLIEHPMSETVATAVEPDELDPALMRQEVAVEYYRMRDRIIQRNGGFVRSQEEEDAYNETNESPKMSRFKAAQLAKLAK